MKKIVKIIGLLFLIVVSLGGYARFIEPNLLKTTVYTIAIPKEVKACRIVFFSDTHLGKLYEMNHLEKIVNQINEANPDIVIFGGDFFDHYARDFNLLDKTYISNQLQQINATEGKYAVYGNHDYGGGALNAYKEVMQKGGFNLLDDESVMLESLNLRIVGFDDYLMGYTHPDLYTLAQPIYSVVVSHEPDVADNIQLAGEGLILAGHSHGGQVKLPFITNKILPKGSKKYVKGYYKNSGKEKNVSLFVSTGIGMTAYPYRFLNVPEIMVVDLQHGGVK